MKSYLWLSCIFIVAISSTEAQQTGNLTDSSTLEANVTVTWGGGQNLCDQCTGGTPASTFACSPYSNWLWSPGNWNNGTKTFMDPLNRPESDYVVTQITVWVYGLFNCILDGDFLLSRFSVSIGEQQVSMIQTQEGRICNCPNCVDLMQFSTPNYPQGWPGYVYNGENMVKIQVLDNAICVNTMMIKFTYSKVSSPDPHTNNNGLLKSVLWLIIAAVGFLMGIIIILSVFLFKRHKSRGRYDIIPDMPTRVLGDMFMLDGKEIKMGPRIGKGSYGEVFKADWRGINVAVKRLPYHLLGNKEFLEDFNREAYIMSTLRHPNTLQFLGTCMVDKDICIITEYMAKGSLYHLLHDESFQITYAMMKKFALDVAQGMCYLHNSKILHRDLKSHNLLVDENLRVKISDFGLSKVVETINGTMTSCGTPAWAAPEVLKNSFYTEKADVYSYGICLWEFWTRKDPYEGMPTFQIIFAVGNQGERPTIPAGCPSEYSQLMRDCWNADPDRRPPFEEIVQRLKDMIESVTEYQD